MSDEAVQPALVPELALSLSVPRCIATLSPRVANCRNDDPSSKKARHIMYGHCSALVAVKIYSQEALQIAPQ